MNYTTLSDTQKIVENFPKIDTAKYERLVNDLFTKYVFVRKSEKNIEYWTSCCGEHRVETWVTKTMTPDDHEIRQAKHNRTGKCPLCHKEVTYKEYRYLGKRKRIKEYHPAVILTERDGDLYVRAYWCLKDYKTLNAMPTVYAPRFYIFSVKEHAAKEIIYPQDDRIYREQREKYRTNNVAIGEPFTEGGWCMMQYTPYVVFGLDAIGKSDFRYCQYEKYKEDFDWPREDGGRITHKYMMRFLTMAAIYPDKVEMLLKSGMGEIVCDAVRDRKKHSTWFNWDAPDVKHAFKGIDRQQLRQIINTKMPTESIDLWAKVRQQGVTLQEINEMCAHVPCGREIIQRAIKRKVQVKELYNYLGKQAKKDNRSVSHELQQWNDYIDMASALGWALKVKNVVFPPHLRNRHDEALAEKNARDARTALEKQQERIGRLDELRRLNEKKMKSRRRKYNFAAGDYFIRVAETGAEIIREGAILGHCVGGYAERHMIGATTILFLRKEADPETVLYTVEMDGNVMRQIHGLQNDRGLAFEELPRQKMAWFLDAWLGWVNAGSRRDKGGNPILPENEKMRQEERTT